MAQLEDLLNGMAEGKRYVVSFQQQLMIDKIGGWYMHNGQLVTIHVQRYGSKPEAWNKVWGVVRPKHHFVGGTYREPEFA